MKRIIGYLRVSTEKQGQEGLGIDAQTQRVQEIAERLGAAPPELHFEVESGRSDKRPVLAKVVAAVKADPNALLVVAKLDRLARDVKLILNLSDGLDGRVLFADFPEIQPGPVGRLMLTLLAAVAEFEARRISERTTDALASVKRRIREDGYYVTKAGRKIKSLGNGGASRAGGRPMKEVSERERLILSLREEGHSLRDIADRLNGAGFVKDNGTPYTQGDIHYSLRRQRLLEERS